MEIWKNTTRRTLEQRKFFNLLVILACDQPLLVIILQDQRTYGNYCAFVYNEINKRKTEITH